MEEKKEIVDFSKKMDRVFLELWKTIIWQKIMLRDMIISLICRWHILIEWAPWLAKTLAVSTLSKILDLDFKRIQFTPDLLPSDLIWAKIYDPNSKLFDTKYWPIFSNFLLADEINRAPSKVQSALLESMAEQQVTIWDETFFLDKPFMVLATQNPIEQDWTYHLPEAQLDRFLLKTVITYPSREEEIEIMKNNSNQTFSNIDKILSKKDILELQNLVDTVYISENILSYIRDIVFYTRESKTLKELLMFWASPRASIALVNASKAVAILNWRDFVIPEDIKEISKQVLRHRLILSYEALADWISTDQIIDKILDTVKIV